MNAPEHAMQPGRAVARRLCLAAVIIALSGGLTQSVQARPIIQPYVSISLSTDNLDLGTVPQPGFFESPATLTVHVAANCAHGGVVVSATPLDGPGDAEIPLTRICVKLPVSGEFVALTDPVVLTGPMNPGIVDVPVKFRLETLMQDRGGKYTGTITFTVGP